VKPEEEIEMRFVISKGERNLADLIMHTMKLQGTGGATRAKQIEDSISKANPGLSSNSELPPGTIVLIPELPDARVTESSLPLEVAAAELLSRLSDSTPDMRKTLEAAVAQSEDDTNREIESLRSSEITKAAKRSPALKDALPAAVAAAQNRLKDLKTVRATQQKGMDALEADLKDLSDRYRTAGGT
jgi:hypothetical protein